LANSALVTSVASIQKPLTSTLCFGYSSALACELSPPIMKVPPLIYTIPFTEVSPLKCKEESTAVAENLVGTFIQFVAESFFAAIALD